MRLKTFVAPDMGQAMRLTKEILGEDAIILSSRRASGGGVEVTIAVEEYEEEFDQASYEHREPESSDAYDEDPTPVAPITIQDDYSRPVTAKERALTELTEILDYHGVSDYLKGKLLKRAQTMEVATGTSIGEIQAMLTRLLEGLFDFGPDQFSRPGAYMFVGPSGAGKSLTLAKVAAQLALNGEKPLLISIDDKQAGSIEQLSAFSEILGLELQTALSRAELRDLIKKAGSEKTILIDSFGCNPYAFAEMKELGEFAGLNDVTPLLVLPAGLDTGEAEEIARVFTFLDIESLIITRTDAAKRYGSILAAAKAGDMAFCYQGSGSRVTGDFRPLDAIALAQMLVQCKREKAASSPIGKAS